MRQKPSFLIRMPLVGTNYDHSDFEDRYVRIGRIHVGIIIVIYTDRAEDVIRIISVRRANREEQKTYYEQ
jgi:uncharacterized DUF497 family protein